MLVMYRCMHVTSISVVLVVDFLGKELFTLGTVSFRQVDSADLLVVAEWPNATHGSVHSRLWLHVRKPSVLFSVPLYAQSIPIRPPIQATEQYFF